MMTTATNNPTRVEGARSDYIAWDASLKLGIDVIDKQHRRIVEYINKLHRIIEAGPPDRNAVASVLERLADYTMTHFRFEEELMAQCGFELVDAHAAGHDRFRDKIDAYRTRLESGEEILNELQGELKLWLWHHILVDDKVYAPIVIHALDGRRHT